MSAAGIVSIGIGLLIVISRAFLVVVPTATLRWFENRISTESRTRSFGASMLILIVPMIWAGSTEDSGLAGVLLVFGLYLLLVGIPWLVLFPRSYMDFCSLFLTDSARSNLMVWRLLGLLGMGIGAVLIYFGWLAL